jgi:predicted permease
MRKKTAFAAAAILTLALAIGGNTVMFTVIRTLLLKPLPYRDPDRLVSLSGGATPTRFAETHAAANSFVELGAYNGPENVALSGAEPEVLKAVRVTSGFLRIPAVEPVLGRSFRPEEDAPGGAPVVMISAELWQRRFGSNPAIAGKSATLSTTEYTIIGVLPPHLQFPFPDIDVWMTAPAEDPLIPARSRELSPYLTVVGRLQPRVSIEQADAEMKVLRRRYALAHAAMLDGKPRPVEVEAMKDNMVTKVRTMLLLLFGAVGLVLLIACANVAGLLLARATSRSREFAVRSALGAARTRLVRQLLAESLLLSLTGGALGVLLAAWGLRAIPGITEIHLPRAGEIHLDYTVLGFTAALSIVTGILFGLAPSLGASRTDLMSTLRASGEAAVQGTSGRIRTSLNLRTLLVIGQVALSLVLLIGAALLVESIAHLRQVDVGFSASNMLTMSVSLPPPRYDTDQKRSAFYSALAKSVETLAGIRSAAVSWYVPMVGAAGTPVQDASQPPLKLNERPIETFLTTTPGYFQTFEIPLKRGRDFNVHDVADSQRVAIIDEGLARQFWPSYPTEDPIGKRIFVGGINPKPAQIVGVVGNVHQTLEGNAWPGTVYTAFTQGAPQAAMLTIRTERDPLRYTSAVREQVRALDRDQAITGVRTMGALVELQVGDRRLLMILLGSFASVALLLALIGIYGIIAYSVSQRTQEFGIRRALGAGQSDIVWLIVRHSLLLMLAGIALGLGASAALTRLVTALLFHVSATDPATFAGVALVFLLVALVASYIPARRAARIDPMALLRA